MTSRTSYADPELPLSPEGDELQKHTNEQAEKNAQADAAAKG